MKKVKILLIDDSYESFEPLKEILEEGNYTVEVIKDSDEAFKKVENLDGYKLILLDLMLPVGDEFELEDADEVGTFLYKKIRKNEKYKELPIIIISALNRRRFESNWKDDNFVKYISKPFSADIKELKEAIEEFKLI